MKVAVLGGSFDPPHIGHYFVTRQIIELRMDIDKILLMPAFKHQWKPIQASVKDRMRMLQCLETEKIEISDIEIKRQGVSYTIDTVKQIKKTTSAFIYWIVGSDILSEFDRWEKTDELLNLTTFLVFPRDPYHLSEKVPQGFEVVEDKHLITTNISSTVVRERIKIGKSIKYLVPREVEEYIVEQKLYK